MRMLIHIHGHTPDNSFSKLSKLLQGDPHIEVVVNDGGEYAILCPNLPCTLQLRLVH